jgi:hypothetical protein
MEWSLCCRQHTNHDDGTYDKPLPISLAYQFSIDVLAYPFGEGIQLSDYRDYLFSLKIRKFFGPFPQHGIHQLSELVFIWMEDVL